MEKSGESWIQEGKGPQLGGLPSPSLHTQVGTELMRKGAQGLCKPVPWNRLSAWPWRTPDNSLWRGRAHPDLPAPSQSGRPQPRPGGGQFVAPLASGWPGQRQLCLLLSRLPGCDKRQMGL